MGREGGRKNQSAVRSWLRRDGIDFLRMVLAFAA